MGRFCYCIYVLQDHKQLKTYWLDGKNGKPRTPPPMEEINEEDEGLDEHHDYTPVSEAEIDRFSHAGSVELKH